MEKQLSLNTTDYITNVGLKRKFKNYLSEHNKYQDIKPNVYPKLLVTSLLVLLEDLVSDCLKFIKKNENNGLYTITSVYVKNLVFDIDTDKYSFLRKYFNKYNKQVKYGELVFFNIKKAFDLLEEKYGAKLMVDHEAYNLICYLFVSFQYDIIDLSVRFIHYSKKCFMSQLSFLTALEYLVNDDLTTRLKLKLDSLNITTNNDDHDHDNEHDDKEDTIDEKEEN